jgi:lysine 2,3-aminomutase
MSDSRVVVRNYEGFISTYSQPTNYRPHDTKNCPYCQNSASEGGQKGVAALLSGERLEITPEGWHETHHREAPEPVSLPHRQRAKVIR